MATSHMHIDHLMTATAFVNEPAEIKHLGENLDIIVSQLLALKKSKV